MRINTIRRSMRQPFTFKQMLSLWVMLMCIPFYFGTVLAQEAKPRVALLEFEGVDVSEAEIASATDQLRDNIVRLGRFTVLDRQQTEAVLGEQAFQQGGVTDASKATELGKLLNVEYIIVGRLTRLRGAYQVNVQMVEVKTAKIVRSDTYRQRDDFLDLLDNLVPLADSITQIEGEPAPAPPAAEEKEEVKPADVGESLPPIASVQGLPMRPTPGKMYLEVSSGSFNRAVDTTTTIELISPSQTVEFEDSGDMGYSRTTAYFGMELGSGIFRGGIGGFSIVQDEDDTGDVYKDLGGGEFAVDYRGGIGSDVGGFHLGYFVSLRGAVIGNDYWDGSVGQFDGGITGSYLFSENWTFYGGAMISSLSVTLEPTPEFLTLIQDLYFFLYGVEVDSYTQEYQSNNPLGVLAGFSYALGEQAKLGVELHGAGERGLAFNGAYIF